MSISLKDHENRIAELERRLNSMPSGSNILKNQKILSIQNLPYYGVIMIPKTTTHLYICESMGYSRSEQYMLYASIVGFSHQDRINMPTGEWALIRYKSTSRLDKMITDRFDLYWATDINRSSDNYAVILMVNANGTNDIILDDIVSIITSKFTYRIKGGELECRSA